MASVGEVPVRRKSYLTLRNDVQKVCCENSSPQAS